MVIYCGSEPGAFAVSLLGFQDFQDHITSHHITSLKDYFIMLNQRKVRWVLGLFLALCLMLTFTLPAVANSRLSLGLVRFKSAFDYAETVQRFETQIQSSSLKLVAKVDHAAAAATVNLGLRPTQVFIFGNPRGGTPLMQCEQMAGIDLPLKALIWQDERQQVWLGYNSASFLNFRHALRRCNPSLSQNLQQIDRTLKVIAIATTQPSKP
jgi:uncharacterized protein (DUF302 family)